MALYAQSLGRPLMIIMCLIMMPLATTELGTDGAITGLMEAPMKEAGLEPGVGAGLHLGHHDGAALCSLLAR